MMTDKKAVVIGGGLAGVEAANQLSKKGIKVTLYEMKPQKFSPAHKSGNLGELVCSNSLKAARLGSAAGLLKAEMRLFGSVCLDAADVAQVPAGGALAVDRDAFAKMVTDKIKSHPNISVIEEEVTQINTDEYTVIAAGPLASDGISEEIKKLTGGEGLHFFDAAAPIVSYDSIDMSRADFRIRKDLLAQNLKIFSVMGSTLCRCG